MLSGVTLHVTYIRRLFSKSNTIGRETTCCAKAQKKKERNGAKKPFNFLLPKWKPKKISTCQGPSIRFPKLYFFLFGIEGHALVRTEEEEE